MGKGKGTPGHRKAKKSEQEKPKVPATANSSAAAPVTLDEKKK